MIRIELPWLPPSSNHAYMNVRGGGGRTLTEAGREFKKRTTVHIQQKYPTAMRLFVKNKPYMIVFRFYFEEVENKSFGQGKAENRYKTFDGGNRTKLLEDALKDAGGIDDSQTMISIWQKEQGTPERTIIWAWSLEDEKPLPYELLRSLQ